MLINNVNAIRFLGIAFSKQVLSFRGIDLEDGKKLIDYLIRNESTIDLSFVGNIKVYVETLMGRRTPFIVKASDTVKSLKTKIQDKLGKIRTSTQHI